MLYNSVSKTNSHLFLKRWISRYNHVQGQRQVRYEMITKMYFLADRPGRPHDMSDLTKEKPYVG